MTYKSVGQPVLSPQPAEHRERALWLAVVERALHDAYDPIHENGDGTYKARSRAEATAWLDAGGNDYRRVLEYAGLDISYMRRVVIPRWQEKFSASLV